MMDIAAWLVPLVLLCLWQQVQSIGAKTNLTQAQRLRLFLNDRNRKQARKEYLRELEWHRTLQLVHDNFPHLLKLQSHPNFYIHDPPTTKRVTYVIMHQPMAGDDTLRHCSSLVADRNKFFDSTEFDAETRRKWDFMNGTSYKRKFDLHQGHFAFGVCNNNEKHCAYLTVLREPFDRLRALLDSCRRSRRNDGWCYGARRMTTKDFLLRHGSTTFRQLVGGMEPCDSPKDNLPCWTRQKDYFDRYIPKHHKSALLDYVLENLESWFSVLGLHEEFETSLRLFSRAHRMPFEDCTIMNSEEAPYDLNNAHAPTESSRTLSKEIEKLKTDPDVLEALGPDLQIYEKAKSIFRRQGQVFGNRL